MIDVSIYCYLIEYQAMSKKFRDIHKNYTYSFFDDIINIMHFMQIKLKQIRNWTIELLWICDDEKFEI